VSEHLENFQPETVVVTGGRPERSFDSPVSPGITLSSTFNAVDERNGVGYGRYGNATWSQLEDVISNLEKGRTLLFSSGMAAISACLSLMPAGSKILASKNGYTGSMRLLRDLEKNLGFEIRFVNIADNDEVQSQADGVDLFWIESPTNPALEVADLPFLINLAKSVGAKVIVDNTFATPLRQQPLTLGADVVMNSVTKFMSGHSDIVMGAVSTNNEEFFNKLHDYRSLGGAIPGPMEVWLALRGIRTMAIRLERAEENAMELAIRLSNHPAVAKVRYPGLPNDEFHQRAKNQFSGFGAILAIEVKGSATHSAVEVADIACRSSKLVHYATSLGGVETLWERRHRWQSESPEVPKELIRIAVGIENIEDLWQDLNQALLQGINGVSRSS
jgi:cystathionine gamma-synthase